MHVHDMICVAHVYSTVGASEFVGLNVSVGLSVVVAPKTVGDSDTGADVGVVGAELTGAAVLAKAHDPHSAQDWLAELK